MSANLLLPVANFCVVSNRDNWWSARTGAEGFPKTWNARDGATEPYRDVFTGVFLSPFPASAVTTQIRNPGQSPGNNEPGTRQ